MKIGALIELLKQVKLKVGNAEVIVACDEEGNGFANVEGWEPVEDGTHKGKVILWPGHEQFLLD